MKNKLIPFLILAVTMLLSCSTIPKPSEKFDGVIIILTEKTGNYTSAGGSNSIDVFDINGNQHMLRSSASGKGLISIKLPEGMYKLESFYTPDQNQRFAVSVAPKTIEVSKGRIHVYKYKMVKNFDRLGSGSYSPSTYWIELSQPEQEGIFNTLRDEKNLVYWEVDNGI